MQDFTKLDDWQRAHRLVLDVYQTTRAFPSDERFGLTAQLRRSAASVPANIAEGAGRTSARDFARFLHIATGSLSETGYHIILSRDLEYTDSQTAKSLLDEVSEIRSMLTRLTQRVTASRTSGGSVQASD
jgi:four helix bundle protein